jgi:hypothetical protein
LAFAVALGALAVMAPVAWAGKPDFERIAIDDTFADDFLTDECGVDVTTHALGHVTARSFDREKGLLSVNTLNIALTATAGDNVYRFRDVGADMVRVTKDGPILSIIGQVPFDFNGVLKINLDTDEIVHEPGHSTAAEIEKACARLTA